jgi:Cu(I)/Ag(I) efflux system membrane protein CusA/SilA
MPAGAREYYESVWGVDSLTVRLRPKFMTFATTCVGLFPIMWATGTGSDVIKRIAAPMVGGIFTSFVLGLLIYPAVYEIWKLHADKERFAEAIEEVGEPEPSIA